MTRPPCLLLLLFLWPGVLAAQDQPTRVTFLDVGQGDAILIRSPEGRSALIDAGPGVDIVDVLRHHGVDTLDLVVSSHPHADHLGGMRQVLEAIPVRYYMDNGQAYTTPTYSAVMSELQEHSEITYLSATPRTLNLGSVALHILPNPDRAGSNANDRSVGIVLEFGAFLGFFPGDSERSELDHFLRAGVVPDVTLLKASHHGSENGFTEGFLEVSSPEVVVISVGAANPFGHPAAAALHAYQAYADQVLRTDRDGEITIAGHMDGSYEAVTGNSSPLRERPDAAALGGVSEAPSLTRGAGERREGESSGGISISVFADAPGNDHQNLNGEYAVLWNLSASPVDLSGWALCDRARHCFTFPSRSRIEAGGRMVLFSGSGRSDGMRYFWGSSSAVWNNRGDTATLFDRHGEVIARYVY